MCAERGDSVRGCVEVKLGDCSDGYVPYVELKSTVKSAGALGMRLLLMSPLLLLFITYVAAFAFVGAEGFKAERIEYLYQQVSSAVFREEILAVCGFVVGAVVALAALSWVRRRRPEDSRYTRSWLVGVLDDALKETISFGCTMILSSLFGVLTLMFWVSALSAQHQGASVQYDMFTGAVLVVVSLVVYMLPMLLKDTGNVRVRECVLAFQDVVSYISILYANGGKGRIRKLSHLEYMVSYITIFLVSSTPAGLLWWLWAGRVGSAVAIGSYIGVVSTYSVFAVTQFLVELTVRSLFARIWFSLMLFLFWLSLYLVFWRGMEQVMHHALGSALVTLVGFWWVAPIFAYGFYCKIPLLCRVGDARLASKVEDLTNRCIKLFSDVVDGGEDVAAVVGEVMPAGMLLCGRVQKKVGWMKVWSRRAVMMVPEGEEVRRPDPRDVDLRAYIVETFGVILPGGGVSASPSPATSVSETIDEWHVGSSY